MPLVDYHKTPSTQMGTTLDVYVRGNGPNVVILPEIPGLHASVFALGDRIAQEGFRVHLLSLFGEDGKAFRYRDSLKEIAKACISREFSILASHRSSPICDWIRSYCADIHERQQKGIGLIGMCLTGNFALSMLAEPWMLAPVLSQPSLPFFPMSGLHVEKETVHASQRDGSPPILGLRFTWDALCPKLRFRALRKTFPQQFIGIEIDSSPNNPHGISPTAHSVLTIEFVDQKGHPTYEAFQETLSFLQQNLVGQS